MQKVICYVRPWNSAQFKVICGKAFGNSDVHYISDFLGAGGLNLQETFYSYIDLYQESIGYGDVGLSEVDAEDIRKRCRLLRELKFAKAKKMIICMWQAIDQVYQEVEPDVGIGLTIDSYVIDLIRLRLSYAGKEYIGIVVSFINDYFRVTARGEFLLSYNPSSKEVDDACYALLVDEQRAHFITEIDTEKLQKKLILKGAIKDKARFYYFYMRLMFSKDKYNYHWMTTVNSSRKNKSLELKLSSKGWSENLGSQSDDKFRMFIPLQYFPEATVDYWTPNIGYIEYYKVLNEIIVQCKNCNVKVFLKEHPAMLGVRPSKFYDDLIQNGHVVLVPTFVNAKTIIKNTDCTMVWTGTAGFEAAVRGKPVIHLGKPYYLKGRWFRYLDNINLFEESIQWARDMSTEKVSEEEQREMVSFVLSGCLPGSFKQPKRSGVGGWVTSNLDDQKVGDSIDGYLDRGHFAKSNT